MCFQNTSEKDRIFNTFQVHSLGHFHDELPYILYIIYIELQLTLTHTHTHTHTHTEMHSMDSPILHITQLSWEYASESGLADSFQWQVTERGVL